jgi:hypothetical protein
VGSDVVGSLNMTSKRVGKGKTKIRQGGLEMEIKRAKRDAARLAPWKKLVLIQQENQTRYLSGKDNSSERK